jgi:precorrin-6B methylase 2
MGDVNLAASPRLASPEVPLSDILKRREVRRIAYFHCDHFEPWRPVPGSRTLEENAEDVIRFAEHSARNEFSRRLTLFYKVHVGVTRHVSLPGVATVAPDDPFGFLPRTAAHEAVFRGAMQGLSGRVPHEVQVHVHHEYYTYNTAHKDPAVVEAFRRPGVRERDASRFELALRLGLEAIRRETDLPLQRWFFVHGLWALNASDPSVCHISDEMQILMRNGGLGDFTFPAGRPNVDPVLEQPYFVRPLDAPRAYLLPQAEPELAFGNALAAREKFFIWASKIRHRGSSIDYFSDHVLQALEDPRTFARQILEQSYVVDGTLYFKTHGHSMHANYWREGEAVVFPHQHSGVRKVMGLVFDAAITAGAEVDFLSAGDIYDEFIAPRPAPSGGFALEAPSNPLTSAIVTPVLASSGTPPLLHIDEINAACTAILREALARDGPSAAGVGNYYRIRAEQGEVLAAYEVRAARALIQNGPFDTVYEIGSGVSALPVLLALNGVRTVGIERDASRVDLSRMILDRMSQAHPDLEDLCEIQRASAPQALRGVDGSQAAAVFTNVTGSTSEQEIEEIIAQMSLFRTVVVDLSRFFETREKTAQAALLDRFINAGWGVPAPIATPLDTYWMFRHDTFDPDDD